MMVPKTHNCNCWATAIRVTMCAIVALLSVGCGDQRMILEGTVTAPDRTTPVPYTKVWYKDYPELTTETDVNGRFTLVDVPGGKNSLYIEKGVFRSLVSFTIDDTMTNVDLIYETSLPFSADAGRLAVVEGSNDQIEQMLDQLGFKYTMVSDDSVNSGDTLANYSVIFLNCGMDYQYTSSAANIINAYVTAGGKIYVSDNALSYIDSAFPGYTTQAGDSTKANVTNPAYMVESRFKEYMGKEQVDITIDLAGQRILDSVSSDVTLFMKGTVTGKSGTYTDRPLLGYFDIGSAGGRVLFSLFHLNKQGENSDEVKKIMIYMIFAI